MEKKICKKGKGGRIEDVKIEKKERDINRGKLMLRSRKW